MSDFYRLEINNQTLKLMLVQLQQSVYRFQFKLSLKTDNSLIILSLSTLLIILSQYHQNMALRSETSFMSVINSIDVSNLIIQNAEFHQIFIILSLILTITIMLKIIHQLCKCQETHKYTETCLIIYYWILFCPINFANVNYLCTSNNNKIIHSFASISVVINVILIGLFGYLYKLINKKHGLAQFSTFYPYNIYRIVTCITIAISNCEQSAYQLYFFNLVSLFLLCINYIMCLNKQQFFYNNFIDNSFQMIVLLQINMHLIYLYSNYSANNLFYQLLLFILFLKLHFQIKQIVILYYLKRIFIPQNIEQQRDRLLIKKIILIIEQMDGSQNNILIFKGILLELKQVEIHLQFRKMKKQILQVLFTRYLQDSIEFAEYTFFKLKNVPKTLLILSNLKSTNQRIYNLKQQVNSFIEILSTSSYLSVQPFYEQMNNENIILQIIDNMTIICKVQIKYWKKVSLNVIVFEQLLNDYKRIQIHLSNCVILFNSLKISTIQRFQWHILKLFFQLYFLNKKLKVRQFENLQSKQLNIEQIFVNEHFHEISSSSEEIGVESGNRLTSNNTAIILIDQNGRILNTNFSINEVVGYSRAELKGQYIERLMPLYFKNRHQNYLNQYLRTGISAIMYKKQYIFYKDKFGAILRAKKYTKQYYNYDKNQFQFIAMLCPIFENNNFIIMNEEWEIMHQTQYFQSLLPIEQGLPLLTLCPKLLHVSKYKQLINPEDLNFFNLRKSKDSIQDKTIFQTMKSSVFGDPTSVVYQSKRLKEYAHNSPLQRMKTNQILDIFKEALLDDKDINTNDKWKSKKLNLRIPQNIHLLLKQYQKARQQLIYDFSYTGKIKVSVFTKNEIGQKKINRNEFCRRFGLLIYQQNFLKFELIKSLYFDYCSDPSSLDRVLKIDASVKFVQTNYHHEHYILLKIRRIEIYDEQKKSFTNQMIGVKKLRKSDTMYSSPTAQYFTELSQIHTERETNARLIVGAEVLRGDFENTGLDHKISFEPEMNIFIKDEQNKPSKQNTNIEFIKLINILYVSTQIFMICILYFFCSYRYNSLTNSNSIILIKQLYNYHLYVIESYNVMINVELFNKGYLDQIVINTPLTNFTNNTDFYDYNYLLIQNCAYYNYVVFSDQNFIKMYYENFYGVTEESGLDVQIIYQVNLYLFNLTDLLRLNEESRISLFYRDYVLTQFIDIVLNSFIGLFYEAEQNQIQSLQLFYILINLIAGITAIYILISLKYNKKIFNNYLVIFRNISIIQNETKFDCQKYWQLRNYQIMYLKQFETHSLQLCSPDEEIENIDRENNRQMPKTKFQFMYKTQGNKILFYCSICTLIQLLMYAITFEQSISHQNESIAFLETNKFIKHNEKFWVLIALKEIYITNNLYNTTVNLEKIQNLLSTFINEDAEQYATDIPTMEQIFHSNLCQTINQEDLQCKTILHSVLTQGMQFYDILLKNQAETVLNSEVLFGENTLYELFEFDTLNNYITQASRLSINLWESNTQYYLDQHNTVSLICFLVQIIVQLGLILGMHYFYLKEHYKIYDVVVKYFRMFMPNISLTQEKRIRVELNRAGIIRR